MAREPYWRSDKDAGLIKQRRSDLGNMFTFLNARIEAMGDDSFFDLLGAYTSFMWQYRAKGNIQWYMEEYGRYAGDIGAGTPPEVIQERKIFFGKLQAHLRLRIESIIRAVESGKTDTLLVIEGPLTILVQAFEDRFVELFDHKGPSGSLDLEAEKHKLDIRLVALIRDLDLKPHRFRICQRCKNFFYQPTGREKNYCSARCSANARQEKYIERKKEERGG